jgi:hypothetical protein
MCGTAVDARQRKPAVAQALIPGFVLWQTGPVLHDTVTIGRAPGSDVCLGDPTVSANHALVYRNPGMWWIRDLGAWRDGNVVTICELASGATSTHEIAGQDKLRVTWSSRREGSQDGIRAAGWCERDRKTHRCVAALARSEHPGALRDQQLCHG